MTAVCMRKGGCLKLVWLAGTPACDSKALQTIQITSPAGCVLWPGVVNTAGLKWGLTLFVLVLHSGRRGAYAV